MLKGPQTAAVATDGSDPTGLPAGVEAAPRLAFPLRPRRRRQPAPPRRRASPLRPPRRHEPTSSPQCSRTATFRSRPGRVSSLSFEQFESKDPFKQQAEATADPDTDVETTTKPEEAITPGEDPKGPLGSADNPPLSTAAASAAPAHRAARARRAPRPPRAAADDDLRQRRRGDDREGQPFPAAQPTFEVVSIAKDGKSLQIGVAGGTLAGGGATVKLTLGKVLTLQNTADGSHLQAQAAHGRGLRAAYLEGLDRVKDVLVLPITTGVRADLRTEEGFGLIELLISIVMLNVGILALVAAFNSGALSIQRASQTATAATLAEKQMELYRAQQYSNVALEASLVTTAQGNATYTGDTGRTTPPR